MKICQAGLAAPRLWHGAAPPSNIDRVEKMLKQVLAKPVTGGRAKQTVVDAICKNERHRICDFVNFIF